MEFAIFMSYDSLFADVLIFYHICRCIIYNNMPYVVNYFLLEFNLRNLI